MSMCNCNQGRLACTCKVSILKTTNVSYAASSAATPVPPAGDVEVQRFEAVEHYQDQFGDKERHVECVTAEDFDTIVTRLTAERDGLLAEVESLKNGLINQIQLRDSELTKARECVSDAGVLLAMLNPSFRGIAKWRELASVVLAHQSAPAAKGGE